MRDNRRYAARLSVIVLGHAAIMAFSVCAVRLIVGGWAPWDFILWLYGVPVAVGVVVATWLWWRDWWPDEE